MNLRTALLSLALALTCTAVRAQQPAPPPQILQTGALNAPAAVLTQDNQWSSLIPILSTSDLDIFIEDPSSDTWLSHYAQPFLDRGQYTITFVSFYKTPRPCREDQVRTGSSDAAHVAACDNDRYAVRRISVDAPENTVTLLFATLVSTNGAPDPSTVHRENRTRGFAELGPDAQKAISEATKLVATQVHGYAIRQHLIS
jgi:hypothetical protein